MARVYSRQPLNGVKVSAGSPIGRNVTAHFPMVRDFRSAVRGRPGLAQSTGPVIAPTVTGKAAVGNGSGKIATGILPSELGMAGASARTVIVEFQQNDVSGSRGVFSFGDNSALTRSHFTLLAASNFRRVTLSTYANDFNYVLWDQNGTYARVFLAITYDGATSIKVRSHCRVFLNNGTPQGVVSRSFSSTTVALRTGDTFPLDLMGGGPYNSASMDTALFNATFIGGRALTEREIDNFYRNSQQIMAAAPVFNYAALDSTPAPAASYAAVIASTEQGSTSPGIAAKQRHKAATASSASADTSPAVAAKQRHKAAISSSTQAATSPAVGAIQRQKAAPAASTQDGASPSLAATQRHKVTLESSTQTSTSPAITIGQQAPRQASIAPSTQANTSPAILARQRQQVTIAASTAASTSPAIIARQRQRATIAASTQNNSAPALPARARHRVTIVASNQLNYSPSVRIETLGYVYRVDPRRVLTLGIEARGLTLGLEDRRLIVGRDDRILNTQGG